MDGVKRIMQYEFSKILGRKKYWVIPIVEILLVLAIVSLSLFKRTVTFASFAISLPNLPLTVLGMFSTSFLVVTIFMLSSDVFALEFENNTIKNVLLRPVSRLQVFVGKNIAIMLYMLVNLCLLLIASIVGAVLTGSVLGNIFQAINAYLLTIIPLIVFILFSSCIACNVKSSSMTMFLLIVIYFVFTVLSLYSSQIYAVLFTNYLSYYKLFTASTLPWGHRLNITFLLFSNTLIFFILGFLSFDRKNI